MTTGGGTAVSHASQAHEELTSYLASNLRLLGVSCDTPGCQASYPGNAYEAVASGWRHDPTRLFRCPGCAAQGWPLPLQFTLRVPAALYKAWAGGDPAPLRAWLDKKFGPLAPTPIPADGGGE